MYLTIGPILVGGGGEGVTSDIECVYVIVIGLCVIGCCHFLTSVGIIVYKPNSV